MTNWGKCPVCGSPAKIGDTHGDNVTSWKIECIRCGNYVIKDNIVDFILGIKNPSSFTFNFNMETAAIASSWIHNKVRTGITTFSIDELKHLNSLQSPTFTEKANNLLLWIAKKSPIPGRSTGFNRSGVYYEAGYARGLNIPVIYTCREDWFNTYILQEIKVKDGEKEVIEKKVMKSEIHFDVNHQNFILWKDGDDLKEKLINRINATINRPK
ncbi:MAG: TFIIB-type zinc ribbon-containing protein [Candidatus Cloacimonetes bacterium]|nr:TFIIB-type zinc ribbon-containing protein [Candidatus Cloacimonadota bacterium]